jgi:hypothetical protein
MGDAVKKLKEARGFANRYDKSVADFTEKKINLAGESFRYIARELEQQEKLFLKYIYEAQRINKSCMSSEEGAKNYSRSVINEINAALNALEMMKRLVKKL